jgi:hypothetical protein
MIAMAAACSRSFAQTTAFTYQGSLANGGLPANGSYDLTFTLFSTNAGGAAIAGPVTNSATAVSNGLFTVTIDFGAGVFNGGNDWLEIAVQTNGGSGFTTLAPRQQITPTPYAIYSANAGSALTATTATTAGSSTTATSATSATSATTATTANNFSGSLAGDVTGTQTATAVSAVGGQPAASVASGAAAANAATNANNPNTIVQRDASGNFNAGTITATSFNGNGGALTNLNASQLTGGTIPTGILTSGATNLPGHLLVVTGGTRQITYNGQSLTNIQGSNVVGAVTLAASATTATIANSATTATTANNFSGSLAGDVTGTQTATVVSAVGGQPAASIASGAAAANAATNANNPNTIVQRDASGNFIASTITATSFNGNGGALTNLNASQLTGGTIPTGVLTSGTTNLPGHLLVVTGGSRQITYNGQSLTNIQGSNVVGAVTLAATATTATSANSATTATTANNFSGSLAGDVTGTQTATVVSAVGGQPAASVASGASAANAATNANNPNTIVQRDASGNFIAGTITANLAGNATTATTATNVTGNIADSQLSGNVALLNGTNVFSGTNSFNGPVIITNGASQFSGTFNGTVIGNVTVTNNYTNFSGSLNGDVTGTQVATVVSTVGGQSAASVASGAAAANAATSANTPNTIVQRDASGNFSAGAITAASFSGNGGALTNLNASQLTSGIVASGLLPSNVALLNGTNTFTGPIAVSNGVVLWGISNYIFSPASSAQDSPVLGNGGGVWATVPIPYFAPYASNGNGMAFDIMTTGNSYTNPIPAWIDVCDEDIRLGLDYTNFIVATLRIDPVNGYVNVGEKAVGLGTNQILPTVIAAIDSNGTGGNVGINHIPDDWFTVRNSSTHEGGASIENTASGAFAFTKLAIRNAFQDTANGMEIDSFSPGYSPQNIYINSLAAIQTESETTNGLDIITISPAAHIKLYSGGFTAANKVMDAQSNLVTFPVSISAPTNKAAFSTLTQSIALGSTFTNLTGGRADFVGQVTFNGSATGNPILVISNLTTGLVITNGIPVVSGTAMQGIVFPDTSPNDICEAIDASTGTGASISFVQGWWIVK